MKFTLLSFRKYQYNYLSAISNLKVPKNNKVYEKEEVFFISNLSFEDDKNCFGMIKINWHSKY